MPIAPSPCAFDALRAAIEKIEAGGRVPTGFLPFGLEVLDHHLPHGGLALGAVHEVAGGGNGAIDGTAAALFAAGIAARTRGQVLWCVTRKDLFAPSLAQAGLAADRVIYVEADDEKTVLACFEEGLRHGGLGAVVGEVARLSMTASRRLQLCAEGSGTMGIAVRRWRRQAEAADFGQPTAANTRWRVTALPSSPLPAAGVGRPRWFIELIRCKAGECADFELEACDETGRLALPADLADRSLAATLGKGAPPAEVAVVMIGRSGRKRMVLAADAAAQALRLYPGMAATQARALCAELVVHDADPEGDAEALDRLALWALKLYAPIVAADPPAGLVIDASGAAHLFGGEEALLADMVARLASAGFAARAAMAGTWGAAHALARFVNAPAMIVPSDHSGRAIAHLPTWALRLPDGMADALGKMGIDTVGEIEAKPRAPLALRFGPELTRRLDQAYGRAAEPIEPVEAPELIQVRQVFAEPIGAPETLARYTLKLVGALCEALEAKGLGARTLDLRFHRVDDRIEVIRVGLAKPVRDIKRLTRLLCDKLETVDPGFGVETMVLAAPTAEPLTWKAIATDLTAAPTPDVADLVDTLTNRLGAGRLYRAAPAQSDVPERSVRRIEPTAAPTGETWPAHWPRPARLLPHPERIETLALLPDQPPTAFTWRGVRRRVKRADGPERIFGEWWRRDGEIDAVRDYFQLEDDAGERFWVFRRGDGEQAATGDLTWFLHGLFG